MIAAYSVLHGLAVDLVGCLAWAALAAFVVWGAASAAGRVVGDLRAARKLRAEVREWRALHARAAELVLWQEAEEAGDYYRAWLAGDFAGAAHVVARVEHERRMASGLPPIDAGGVEVPDALPRDDIR